MLQKKAESVSFTIAGRLNHLKRLADAISSSVKEAGNINFDSFTYVCVCVCVCERERERERGGDRGVYVGFLPQILVL